MARITRKDVGAEVTKRVVWHAGHTYIINKQGKLVTLVCNDEQIKYLWYAVEQEMHGYPVRLIVLKARKVGISTIIEAEAVRIHNETPYLQGLVCAQTDNDSQTLFEMARRMHSHNPEAKKLTQARPGKKVLEWKAPHDSKFEVATAGRQALKRGATLLYVHGSEIAFWASPKVTLLSVLNAVPDTPGNTVVLESTANGFNEWKERWDRAVAHRREHPKDATGYLPLFFSWLDHKEYAAKVPKDYKWGDIDNDEQFLRSLKTQYCPKGASDEQLYWRRVILDDKCGGDPKLFMQEYPATPDQAFLATGRPGIPANIINRHRKTSEIHGIRIRLEWEPDGTLRPVEGQWNTNYWEVWEKPDDVSDYCIGADVATGLQSDKNDPRSSPDRHSAFVLNRREFRQVARWEGPEITENDLGRELLKAGKWYADAWLSPEVNNTGKATLLVLTEASYPNLYQRQKALDSIRKDDVTPKWGWYTDVNTRPLMISDWIEHNRIRMDGNDEGKMVVRSADLVHQEETFIITKTGKKEHAPGAHDDELFAAMIALQLHILCPRQSRHEIKAVTQIEDVPEDMRSSPAMMYAGGFDNSMSGDEDTYEETI